MAVKPRAVIVMGASGAGKSTVGRALAQALGWPFYDGDDYHPSENVALMAAGVPLTDSDRRPWLVTLNQLLREQLRSGQSVVLACSALKSVYRERISLGIDSPMFVYLRAGERLLQERLLARPDHFMPVTLLPSQLAALEEPDGAIVVDAALSPEAIVRYLVSLLSDESDLPGL